MSILIKGMEMPTTGLYFVSVDNTGGRDKTVVIVERMLGNRDARQIVGSFELVPVPPHGRLIDADALKENAYPFPCASWTEWAVTLRQINAASTVIPAEGEE